MDGRRTVLVVDDEPITRMDLTQMLEGLGYAVVGGAGDGFDAVELCRTYRPQLVLMDIKMPTFDGLTASDTIIREELADCVVLLTAFSDSAFVNRAAQIGVAGYLIKPVEEARMGPALEVAMAQAQLVRKAREDAQAARLQLEQSKVVDRAKLAMAREAGITEGEAYQRLQKMAMDKRCSIHSLAQSILAQSGHRALVAQAKEHLMQSQKLSEAAAYRKITQLARQLDDDLEAAARQVLRQ